MLHDINNFNVNAKKLYDYQGDGCLYWYTKANFLVLLIQKNIRYIDFSKRVLDILSIFEDILKQLSTVTNNSRSKQLCLHLSINYMWYNAC